MRWFCSFFALLFVVVVARPVDAHGMMTAYLEITETASGVAVGTWKLPVPSRDVTAEIEGCTRSELANQLPDGQTSQHVYQVTFQCPGSLAGRELKISGLGVTVSEAVVRIALSNGTTASHVLGKRESIWRVPATQSTSAVLARYVALGVEHILTGPDHLLFVLGLVLLVGTDRKKEIAWTATFFTLAHSITLSATVLGVLRVSSAAAEATIAATLVLLALDLGRAQAARRPRSTAFAFGLVHGLGFAGALSEIGLPQGAIAPALFAFNLGVELGQLGFVVAILILFAGVQQRFWGDRMRRVIFLHQAGTYAIGSFGVFWMLQRWVVIMSHRL